MRFHNWPLLILLELAFVGCGSSASVNGRSAEMVFVDVRTMAPVIRPPSDTLPASNPSTGEHTLMPGLYCADCRSWYPVPPPDQINRRAGAALCPKTGTPLVLNGPWPEDVSAVANRP